MNSSADYTICNLDNHTYSTGFTSDSIPTTGYSYSNVNNGLVDTGQLQGYVSAGNLQPVAGAVDLSHASAQQAMSYGQQQHHNNHHGTIVQHSPSSQQQQQQQQQHPQQQQQQHSDASLYGTHLQNSLLHTNHIDAVSGGVGGGYGGYYGEATTGPHHGMSNGNSHLVDTTNCDPYAVYRDGYRDPLPPATVPSPIPYPAAQNCQTQTALDQPQPTQTGAHIPTYKWMQVKRSQPKTGESHSSHLSFSGCLHATVFSK